MIIRKALKEEAPVLARLMNKAGSGIPLFCWKLFAEGGDPWDFGANVVTREGTEFSYQNCSVVVDEKNQILALLNSFEYQIHDEKDGPALPPVVIPIDVQEQKCAGNWLVNFLATADGAEGKGCGRLLLDHAVKLGTENGNDKLNLVVRSGNENAIGLYKKVGFQVVDEVEATPMGEKFVGETWMLMEKHI